MAAVGTVVPLTARLKPSLFEMPACSASLQAPYPSACLGRMAALMPAQVSTLGINQYLVGSTCFISTGLPCCARPMWGATLAWRVHQGTGPAMRATRQCIPENQSYGTRQQAKACPNFYPVPFIIHKIQLIYTDYRKSTDTHAPGTPVPSFRCT